MRKIVFTSGVIFIHTVLLLLLFHTSLFHNLVFFYRGVLFISLTSLLYWFVTKKKSIALIFFCVHMMFFTLVPVTLDRSISLFMLQYMNNHANERISNPSMESELISTYIQKRNALDKRFLEQMQSGTVEKKQDGYQITQKGIWLVRLFSIIGKLFAITN